MQTTPHLLTSITDALTAYASSGQRLVISSSFQTHSVPLLHILQRLQPGIPVAFLDTGYHFAETIEFRDQVADLLDLTVVELSGHEQVRASGLYVTNETGCCNINKVEPLHQFLEDFDVWISGVRSDQTKVRKSFDSTMPGPRNTERYHPMLAWTDLDIARYRDEFDLPSHPLDALGYRSIGCEPCTTIPTSASTDRSRAGRWSSTEKTECGLHLV